MPGLQTLSLQELQEQLQAERRLVSYDSYDITVRQLLDMFESGDIYVPPEYQRQFIWEPDRQSTLIESAFLGIPIPSLFMATNENATWEVVDGVQRLCSLAHFAGNAKHLELLKKASPLVISGLEKLSALNGIPYGSLPKSLQLGFITRPIRVTVLNDKSDLNVRFDLFERLNTGGVALTAQEIRNCIYRGPFNNTLKDLSKNKDFLAVVKFRDGDRENGTPEEMVLRFFAFLERYQIFEHGVKEFLNKYMNDLEKTDLPSEKRELFAKTFKVLRRELPNGIIRGNRAITPVNLYEAVSVGTALAISATKPIGKNILVSNINSAQLKKWTSGGTNSRKMVTNRIQFVRALFG